MIKQRVLFVCTGNICRSPTAEGVARSMAERAGLVSRFEFDSAGTHGYHVGEPPDSRTVKAAARRGYDLAPLRARRVSEFDFVRFDHILALDVSHLEQLRRACPSMHRGKLALLLDYSARFPGEEVPDPYYGGAAGFEQVLDMIEDAIGGLLERLGPTLRA